MIPYFKKPFFEFCFFFNLPGSLGTLHSKKNVDFKFNTKPIFPFNSRQGILAPCELLDLMRKKIDSFVECMEAQEPTLTTH